MRELVTADKIRAGHVLDTVNGKPIPHLDVAAVYKWHDGHLTIFSSNQDKKTKGVNLLPTDKVYISY